MSNEQEKLDLTGGTAMIPVQKLVDHAQDLMLTLECQAECTARTLRALHETIQAAASAAGLQLNNRLSGPSRSGGDDKDDE